MIVIIIIIIFVIIVIIIGSSSSSSSSSSSINCNWVVTRWQWLFYMYTNMRKKPPLGVVFYSPLVGFSLLACEVS